MVSLFQSCPKSSEEKCPLRGLILAGGHGTRLSPTTKALNKHLIPLFDKPLIYYPLCNLILAGIREITIISNSMGSYQLKMLFGDTLKRLGLTVEFLIQEEPKGISDAIRIFASQSPTDDSVLVILGDNFFYGPNLGRDLESIGSSKSAICWTQQVKNPSSYGIAIKNSLGLVTDIVEKPEKFRGNDAVTGLYYFPNDLVDHIQELPRSNRGEFEITELLNRYLHNNALECRALSRSVFWRDAGTPDNLLDTSNFIHAIQNRQQILVGSPEEAAFHKGFISEDDLRKLICDLPESDYRELLELIL